MADSLTFFTPQPFFNQMSGSFDPNNYVLLLVAATIYLHSNQPESALKVLHSSDHQECSALKVQVSSESALKVVHYTDQLISDHLECSSG